MTGKLKIFAINWLVFIVLLLIIELIFGTWVNQKNVLGHLNIPHNKTYQLDVSPLYSSPISHIQYSRDQYGLRGQSAYNKPGEIDILTVGGSTTDQQYIDDSQTWQEVLEDKLAQNALPYVVSNAGVNGQSTYGHLMSFEYWFPLIPHLKPKYIAMYIGINDINRFFRGEVEYEHRDFEDTSWVMKVKHQSAIYQLVRNIKGNIISQQDNIGHKSMDFEKYEYTTQQIMHPDYYARFHEQWIPRFKKRLELLIEKCKDLGAEPIFITQPSFRYKVDTLGQVLGITHLVRKYAGKSTVKHTGVDHFLLLQKLNEAIHEVAGTAFLVVDITPLPLFDSHDFYDFAHMTPSGVKKVGEIVAQELISWEITEKNNINLAKEDICP